MGSNRKKRLREVQILFYVLKSSKDPLVYMKRQADLKQATGDLCFIQPSSKFLQKLLRRADASLKVKGGPTKY